MSKQVKLLLAALAVAVAGCCALLLLPKEGGTLARVTLDGQLVQEFDLSVQERQTLALRDEQGAVHNLIEVEPGRIRMAQASCPDQVCVNQGWISDSALPIVCLPNKVVIEITGGEGGLDAAVK